jgi:hypothetical protein
MKKLLCACICFALTACAYNYNVGVAEGSLKSEISVITFDNTLKVSKIDGKNFSRKPSIWVDGSHSIEISPGLHTFTLRYDGRSMHGGAYTDSDSIVEGVLEKGRAYKIESKLESGYFYFYIVEDLTAKGI